MQNIIVSISPGKRADLLITRCDSIRMTAVHDPVAALVLYANASDIDTVFIDGELVKHKGLLTGVDWPKVRRELRDSATSIMERSKNAPAEDIEAAITQMLQGFAGIWEWDRRGVILVFGVTARGARTDESDSDLKRGD